MRWYWVKHKLRWRCHHPLGRRLVYSIREPDRIDLNGHIVSGNNIEVFGTVKCHRLRWHRGEHVE